ncbi:hypothetical protein B0H10DRAFT_320884 [Mycena sp. CBHHK59/15]|nr:hypothetical protein B0H10DRAFT_320884 [Mycena sp. CBHHK59/15]
MDESSDKLASTQAEVEDWKAKYLAIQSRVDENERKLSLAEAEVGAWKAKSAAADASRDVAESSLHSANATISQNSDKAKTDTQQWIAKAAAWDTERTRLKAANAHNAKGITQLRIDATRLKGQHRDVVQERDQLKNSFEADNAKSLATLGALTAEVEDLKKKLSAALSSPKPPTGMFINNKARTIAPPSRSLPNKPETETPAPNKNTPRIPESTAAVPMGATPRRSFNQPNPAANPSPDQPSSEGLSNPKTVERALIFRISRLIAQDSVQARFSG